MVQPAGAATRTFFPLLPHHLLFPHLFLHFSPSPSFIPHLTSPPLLLLLPLLHHQLLWLCTTPPAFSTGPKVHRHPLVCASMLFGLCCTTLQSFFPYCCNQTSITRTRAVKTNPPQPPITPTLLPRHLPFSPSVFLSVSNSLW